MFLLEEDGLNPVLLKPVSAVCLLPRSAAAKNLPCCLDHPL